VNIGHNLTGRKIQGVLLNSEEIDYRVSFMKRGLQVKDDGVGNGKAYIYKPGNTEMRK
jgi:hypothetical protein